MAPPFIYVVDDEPGIVRLCERLLSRAGYRVKSETNSRKAVEYLQENPVNLLLVDIRMPGLDGFEVIQQIQKLQPDSAILIMTGYGTVETAIRALRQGVDGLMLKPFGEGRDLIDAVEQAFADNRKKRDAARTQALRPLFSVTESLLSEIRREPLLQIIIDSICSHLQCTHAACYIQNKDDPNFTELISRGLDLVQKDPGLIHIIDRSVSPILINSSGFGDDFIKKLLTKHGLGTSVFLLIQRPNMRMLFYAARTMHEAYFSESDLEMIQILARQAAAAFENSRLYTEQLEYVRKVEESQKALLQSEKMASAGRLSASIAHEVNNPLQSVQNCLHLAGHEDLSQEKRKEYFDLARAELDRLTVTVRRMLEFYRPGPASFENVDIEEMLHYILHLMSRQLSEVNLQVILQLESGLKIISAVSSQIQQVFINLILNALDAMDETGGQLKISAKTLQNGVEIIFQDNGKGVPQDLQSSIFDPFISSKEGGMGLGLTVSYNIVTAHGGTLEYVQKRGPGACFKVYLPDGGVS